MLTLALPLAIYRATPQIVSQSQNPLAYNIQRLALPLYTTCCMPALQAPAPQPKSARLALVYATVPADNGSSRATTTPDAAE